MINSKKMINSKRKFRVVKPTTIQKTFGSTKYGWYYTIVSETDIKCYWHSNGEAKDELVRTIKFGDVISIYEKIIMESDGQRTDYFTQEITPAEDILKRMLEVRKVRDYDCNQYEIDVHYTTVELIEEEYDNFIQYGIGDLDAESVSWTILSKEEYDYLKSLEKKNEN